MEDRNAKEKTARIEISRKHFRNVDFQYVLIRSNFSRSATGNAWRATYSDYEAVLPSHLSLFSLSRSLATRLPVLS